MKKISTTCKKEELSEVFAKVAEIIKSKSPEFLIEQNINEDEFSGTFNVAGQFNNFESSFGNTSHAGNGTFSPGQDFFDLPPQPSCNMLNLWNLL